MIERKSPLLFVSFWKISLDNLPESSFTHRRLTPEDARARIQQASYADALLCLTEADLLAPYRKRERDNHQALCALLNEQFDIGLTLKDFFSVHGEGSESLYTVNALNLIQIQENDQLMIISCDYTFAEKGSGLPPEFSIEPTTVEFHIIETTS